MVCDFAMVCSCVFHVGGLKITLKVKYVAGVFPFHGRPEFLSIRTPLTELILLGIHLPARVDSTDQHSK